MYRLYWRSLIRPSLGKIALLAGLITVTSLTQVFGISLIVPLISLLLESTDSKSDVSLQALFYIAERVGLGTDKTVILPFVCVLLFVLVLVNRGLTVLLRIITTWIQGSIRIELLSQMFYSFLAARYNEVARRGRAGVHQDLIAGGLVSRLVLVVSNAISALMSLVSLSLLSAYLSWETTLLTAVLIIPTAVVVRRYLDLPNRKLSVQVHELGKRRNLKLFDAIDGIKVAKMQGLQKKLADQVRDNESELMRIQIKGAFLSSMPGAMYEVLGVSIVLVLVFLALYVPNLELSLPTIAAQVAAFSQIIPATATLSSMLLQLSVNYKQIMVVGEVLYDIERETDEGIDLSAPVDIQTIEFRSVSFAYPERPNELVLDDASLCLRRGQVTAIVGPTGAGKTTLADLVVRLYDPSSGEILVNGINLGDIRLSTWRSRIGYVGQDTFLFNGTLWENIVLWRDDIEPEQVRRAATDARIHSFILSLPRGYETQVGDRGVKLSGGQRQRVAIARAILHRPQVLIFDEATSALDNVTEDEIQRAINNLRDEAIILVIAHRLGTVRDADNIVVLESGKTIERGRHETLLMDANGRYAQLYNSEARTREPAV